MLLLVFCLGLVDNLLLLLVLVLIVCSLLGRFNCPLVGETIEDAKGKGGPPQNLNRDQLAYDLPSSNFDRATSWRGRRGKRCGHECGRDSKKRTLTPGEAISMLSRGNATDNPPKRETGRGGGFGA